MSLVIAPAVSTALAEGSPVVALESTIIAHGFPRPRNLELAIEMEHVVADLGATPATVAIIGGDLVVGVDRSQLRLIATEDVDKVNVSNLAVAVATGLNGATTVSATLRAARLAGIGVLATGGIGGVHRGTGRDVSSDLGEMAASAIGVVSAGAKAFLDIATTLDYLETLGVTVIGYRTNDFPAFYSPTSGIPLGNRVDSPGEAARVIAGAGAVQGAGVLIANPIPSQAAIDSATVAEWTDEAMRMADSSGVTGLARSPFVLSAIADISGGRSVESNAALAYSNAALATQIAVELAPGDGRRSGEL